MTHHLMNPTVPQMIYQLQKVTKSIKIHLFIINSFQSGDTCTHSNFAQNEKAKEEKQ